MWQRDGDTWVTIQTTQKPFGQFRTDATRGLLTGIAGLFTTHQWNSDQTCTIKSLGADGSLTYEESTGRVTCRVRILGFPATFLQEKILSDVGAITADVCAAPAIGNKDVFIVHGHALKPRTDLRDFLSFDLKLRPVVLVEQDDRGLAIIEKFEYYARGCAFAFVLMTPDDQARGDGPEEAQRRARQNVVLELGWFMAHLGRSRVAILYNDKLEIPSDITGVISIEFKDSIREQSETIRKRLAGVGLIAG